MKPKKKKKTGFAVPREWEGETAFILGGGPSLADVNVDALRGRGRVIAINDAGFTRAPWADVHFCADRVWFKWEHNQRRLGLFKGRYRITRQTPPPLPEAYDIRALGWDAAASLSRNPTRIAGRCGGGNSINLAWLFGADPIILLGFDMRPGSWHGDHKRRVGADSYVGEYIPALVRMAVELTREGATVINATPASALPCFPIMPLQEAIAMGEGLQRAFATARASRTRRKPTDAPESRIESENKVAQAAIDSLGLKAGDSVLDLSPDDPALGRALAAAGLKVETGHPEDPARLSRQLPPVDYIVCETMAEKVPAARAELAIKALAALAKKGAFLRIETREAVGPRMTKRNAPWWLGKLGLYFRSVVLISERVGAIEVACKHD